MEKVNQKKLAKATLLTASLAMGITLGQSFFNGAQATGGGGSPQTAGCLRTSNPNTMDYCCACGGSNCYGVCC